MRSLGFPVICFGPFGGGGGQPAPQQQTSGVSSGGGTPNASTGPYPDDGSRRMPVSNSLSAIEAGRRKRAQIIKRTGRASTRLAGSPGTQSYVNQSVGGTN